MFNLDDRLLDNKFALKNLVIVLTLQDIHLGVCLLMMSTSTDDGSDEDHKRNTFPDFLFFLYSNSNKIYRSARSPWHVVAFLLAVKSTVFDEASRWLIGKLVDGVSGELNGWWAVFGLASPGEIFFWLWADRHVAQLLSCRELHWN
jgi:hypothetical protein